MARTRKELAIFLTQLEVFDSPNPILEQYPSDSNVAAALLWQAMLQGNIEDKPIIDLGCGTGILGIGALLLGAKHVEFIDVDPSMYTKLKKNLEILTDNWEINIEGKWSFTNANVMQCPKECRDDLVVITNPPFGARKKHADKRFLQSAFRMANTVYSMHKTSTKVFIEGFIRTENLRKIYEEDVSFPIKHSLQEHKRRISRIEVTLYGLVKNIEQE